MKSLKRRIKVFAVISAIYFTAHTNVCMAQSAIKIPEDSLPKIIHDELHKKYSAYKVNSITKKSEHEKITYSLEIQKKNTLLRLLYDSDGKLLSKDKSKIFTFYGTEPVKSKPVQSDDGHNHQH